MLLFAVDSHCLKLPSLCGVWYCIGYLLTCGNVLVFLQSACFKHCQDSGQKLLMFSFCSVLWKSFPYGKVVCFPLFVCHTRKCRGQGIYIKYCIYFPYSLGESKFVFLFSQNNHCDGSLPTKEYVGRCLFMSLYEMQKSRNPWMICRCVHYLEIISLHWFLKPSTVCYQNSVKLSAPKGISTDPTDVWLFFYSNAIPVLEFFSQCWEIEELVLIMLIIGKLVQIDQHKELIILLWPWLLLGKNLSLASCKVWKCLPICNLSGYTRQRMNTSLINKHITLGTH